jgi:protein phosphatase
VGALVQSGQLTPEEARVHPMKNEILQAIGMPCGVVPEFNTRTLANGDRVLLCSDGLWEALSETEIHSIVEWEGTMRQLATQLVDRANDAGGYDNVTVILYGPHSSCGSGRPPA